MLRPLAVAALLAAGLLATTLPAAAASTARASAVLELHSAPASYAPIVGYLAKNQRVTLSQCTRHSRWCLAHPLGGGPSGWVLGSYLIGSPAKNAVTPAPFVEPFWLFPNP